MTGPAQGSQGSHAAQTHEAASHLSSGGPQHQQHHNVQDGGKQVADTQVFYSKPHVSKDHQVLELQQLSAAAISSSSSVGTDSSEMDIKGSHGHHQQHHQHNALLAPIPTDQQLNLRWERISAFVSTDYDDPGMLHKTVQRCKGQEVVHEKKQILHEVCGEMLPGELLALMGPSGSGKTSLLSIIAGRAAKAVETRGRVTSGGQRLTKAAKRRIGFVLQDDLLYETLTVWETLNYAAALRLPRDMTSEQRAERVQAVITALGLNKCVDTIIGGFFRRGISGGERKRVSIGHELLINPALLLLDEPTSGLDSTTALHLLVTLKQLAQGGRAIATTIHQPSSRLYQQLDRLVLLAEGHVVYYGSSAAVVPWFATLGFAMPYGVNVADFLLDLAQGEVEGGSSLRLMDSSSASAAGGKGGVEVGDDDNTDAAVAADAKKLLLGGAAAGAVPAAVPAAAGDLMLSGPAAIQALYSSYKFFAAKHNDGFDGEHQLQDLRLALEPPPSQQQLAAAAAAAAAAAKGGAGSGSFLSRSINKAGSFLRLESLGGGASQQQQQQHVDTTSDDPELGQPISRAWSRSRSFVGGGGPGGAAGGKQQQQQSGFLGKVVHDLGVADRGGASFFTQWNVLLKRAIKVKRFESLSSQRFWQGIAVAVITGLFWWQRGRGSTLLAASDVIGLLFFELLFPAFTAMFTALFVFPNDFRMLLKERASGMYRVSAFYLASACSDLPMDCAYPVMFVVIIYLMGGLKLTATAFFANVFAVVLNVLTAQSLGLFLGAAVMNTKTAQTIASVMMLGFMLVGGYYVRGIPVWAAWLRYISFVFWGFNLLVKIQFRGSEYIQCGTGGLAEHADASHSSSTSNGVQACHPVTNLQAALQLPTDPNASPALEIGVLFLMLVGLRVMVYITLRMKTKSV